MTTPLPAALAEVLALAEKATPGRVYHAKDKATIVDFVEASKTTFTECIWIGCHTDHGYEQNVANAAFVASAINFVRNHGPALTRLLAEQGGGGLSLRERQALNRVELSLDDSREHDDYATVCAALRARLAPRQGDGHSELVEAAIADSSDAWTDEDARKPWGCEIAFLRHLANDPAMGVEKGAMLRHCAKRLEATAGQGDGQAVAGQIVAFQRRSKADIGGWTPWSDWDERDRDEPFPATTGRWHHEYRPLYTAPPAPDAARTAAPAEQGVTYEQIQAASVAYYRDATYDVDGHVTNNDGCMRRALEAARLAPIAPDARSVDYENEWAVFCDHLDRDIATGKAVASYVFTKMRSKGQIILRQMKVARSVDGLSGEEQSLRDRTENARKAVASALARYQSAKDAADEAYRTLDPSEDAKETRLREAKETLAQAIIKHGDLLTRRLAGAKVQDGGE